MGVGPGPAEKSRSVLLRPREVRTGCRED
jgi:hypothetical protein